MTRREFLQLTEKKIVLLDGATGTNLQKRGMPVGVCPEQWILENKEIVIHLQREYVEAGVDILYAPTFSGNRIKLEEYGLVHNIEKINRELVRLSKEAAMGKVLVAGDLTMTGEQLFPIGKLTFEELVDIYKEQIAYMLMEEVDLIVVETMMSLQECRAAVLAVKEICDLPVMVTLTFAEDMRTLYGTDPETAMIVLQNMGADAVGVNCSTGPEKMCEVVKRMKKVANIPVIAKPNAGLPQLVGKETVFDMGAEAFAKEVRNLIESGAGVIGGCCGTTPEHIKELANIIINSEPPYVSKERIRALTTETTTLEIDLEGRFLVVGERINPTGKKALQAELKEKKLDMVTAMALEQIENGAHILDVNMGMNGIDEKEMMLNAVYELTRTVNVPLCIDSSDVDIIQAALRIYPGRALINSISLEDIKIKNLIPAAKKYGAMFILLPVSEKGLPKDLEEKKDIIKTIVNSAYSNGLGKEDIIVDGLVNTIGANKKATIETMETIRFCKKEMELATICGLSNISFGLPDRQFVNSTFLAFAMKEGLTMAIANPSQDLLMNTAFAADLLMNKEDGDIRYINKVTANPTCIMRKAELEKYTPVKETAQIEKKQIEKKEEIPPVFEDVVKGNRKSILDKVNKVLQEGISPSDIIDTMLIPAINQVGDLFDKQIYFLPQLISSAETMKKAIDYLEPMLEKGKDSKKIATVVVATVAGDIHDIGKNLVVLMLKNYGFHVIDLGKDVPSEKIVDTAEKEKAEIIGLSALMTTTMMEMKTVVDLVKEKGLKSKVIIGGAAITQSFADEIGADGYSKDAQEAVKLVQKLLNLS